MNPFLTILLDFPFFLSSSSLSWDFISHLVVDYCTCWLLSNYIIVACRHQLRLCILNKSIIKQEKKCKQHKIDFSHSRLSRVCLTWATTTESGARLPIASGVIVSAHFVLGSAMRASAHNCTLNKFQTLFYYYLRKKPARMQSLWRAALGRFSIDDNCFCALHLQTAHRKVHILQPRPNREKSQAEWRIIGKIHEFQLFFLIWKLWCKNYDNWRRCPMRVGGVSRVWNSFLPFTYHIHVSIGQAAAAYKAIAVKEIENYDKLILPFFDSTIFLSFHFSICLLVRRARSDNWAQNNTTNAMFIGVRRELARSQICVVRKTRWKGGKFFFLSLPISDIIRFVICRQMPISLLRAALPYCLFKELLDFCHCLQISDTSGKLLISAYNEIKKPSAVKEIEIRELHNCICTQKKRALTIFNFTTFFSLQFFSLVFSYHHL